MRSRFLLLEACRRWTSIASCAPRWTNGSCDILESVSRFWTERSTSSLIGRPMTRLARWSGRGPRKVPLATPALAELLSGDVRASESPRRLSVGRGQRRGLGAGGGELALKRVAGAGLATSSPRGEGREPPQARGPPGSHSLNRSRLSLRYNCLTRVRLRSSYAPSSLGCSGGRLRTRGLAEVRPGR
jgi:hypothetical protein